MIAGQLTSIRVSAGPTATRVVLDLDRAASHRLFELSNPDRIVIDLPNTAAGATLRLPEAKGRIKSVRTGSRPGGELRVVLDLTSRAESKSFPLGPEGGFGHRIVIDLTDADESARVRRVPTDPGRDVVVVIDAGHGGGDPGAIGPNGTREKVVTLAIARRLAALVDAEPGMRAVMTRNSDRRIELRDRVRIAREAQADLLISIHADAYRNASASGATVYTLKTERARRELARLLENSDNDEELVRGVSRAQLDDDVVARIVLDLSQGAAISESRVAAERIIEQLSRVTKMRKTTVEQESLAILTAPDVPSVIVESAYISNPREEANLRDPGYQNMLANALFAGIVDYFRTNPPPDTFIAANPPAERRGPIQHVIARGETLSEIAERYRVSLRSLRSTNQLRSDTIRIGQVLTIPTTG